ncbi:MAG: preprotein translocase subunit SecE [Porticoccaceae bacterium]|jgi:preprotein translocase subunit SecE|nr:preprotein translocase subunit SecE [Porticoccaceae bacterium]
MSVAAPENNTARLDLVKWLVVLLLVGGGIYGNYYFSSEAILFRALALVVIAVVAIFVALKTAKGGVFWELLKGARVEARRVVWPTKQECNQTTLVVVGFIFVMALILWGLDSLFGWLTSLIIG